MRWLARHEQIAVGGNHNSTTGSSNECTFAISASMLCSAVAIFAGASESLALTGRNAGLALVKDRAANVNM